MRPDTDRCTETISYERLVPRLASSAWRLNMMVGFAAQHELGNLRTVCDPPFDGSRILRDFIASMTLRHRMFDLTWSTKQHALVAVCSRSGLSGWGDIVVVEGLVISDADDVGAGISIRTVAMDPFAWILSRLGGLVPAAVILPAFAYGALGVVTAPLGQHSLHSQPAVIQEIAFGCIVLASSAVAYRAIRRGPSRDAVLASMIDRLR